jgi:hypothetical protein
MNFAALLTSAAVIAGCASSSAAPQAAATPDKTKTATVAEMAAQPDKFLGGAVRVTGRLENAGDNYFSRRRRIVLTDGKSSIDVTPWLPIEVPPSPSGQQRPTLATYLDQDVELLGTLRRTETRPGAPAFLLEVRDAKVVKRR